MAHSLLKLSQAYADGRLEKKVYRQQRHALIENILSGGDIEDATVQPGKLKKLKTQPPSASSQSANAPKQVQVEKPAQKETSKQTPLTNDKTPVPVVQDKLPEPAVTSKHKIYGLVLLLVVSGGAFIMLQNEPQTPIATVESAKEQIPESTTVVAPVKTPEPVLTPEPENFSQQFDQMTADGQIDVEEDELFFELWEDSTTEEQSQWKAAVFKEKLSFEESTDPLRIAKNEYIVKILDEIENLEIDNAPIIVKPDVEPAPLITANTTTNPEPAVSPVTKGDQLIQKGLDIQQSADPALAQTKEQLKVEKDNGETRLVDVSSEEEKEEQVAVADEEQSKPLEVVQVPAQEDETELSQSDVKDQQEKEAVVVNVAEKTAYTVPAQVVSTQPMKSTNAEKDQLKSVTHKVIAGETLYSISRKYNVSKNSLTTSNPGIETLLVSGKNISISGAKKYTVVENDNLSAISAKYNVTIKKLVELNPGIETVLKKGSEIIIPGNTALEVIDLQHVFDRLLNDELLSFESLKAFDNQWAIISGPAKLKIYEFEGFAELNQRLQELFTPVSQGESDRGEKDAKLIARVAEKFTKVKRKFE